MPSAAAALALSAIASGSSRSKALPASSASSEGCSVAARSGSSARTFSGCAPTGNLDPRAARAVLELLRERVLESAGSGVLITHSRAAAATADRVLTFDGRRLTPLGEGA